MINFSVLKLSDAYEEYEEAFFETLLEIQKDLFGEDKIKYFLEIPFAKHDWNIQARKSFLKIGLQWAYVDLVQEANTYKDWIDHVVREYSKCACHGSGCASCLI